MQLRDALKMSGRYALEPHTAPWPKARSQRGHSHPHSLGVGLRCQWSEHLRRILSLTLVLALWAPVAHAALFEDEEARRAILELRQKQEAQEAQQQSRQLAAEQLKSSLLGLNNQIEVLRAEVATLRGQQEQLMREVAELQRHQKNIQQGVEDRMKRLEPQKVTLDDKEFFADPDEKRQFDDAMSVLRKGDFAAAAVALQAFQRRYPNSGYSSAVLYWLGNAQYGKREYKEAMASFRALVAAAPEHLHAADALLSIANCQIELKDSKGAKRTLEGLLKTYPRSEAANVGRGRLVSLK